MTLSVCKLWIGFDKSVDDMVVMIANKGLPTEQRWALGPWTAIDAGADLTERGSKLLRQQLFVDTPSIVEKGSEPPKREQKESQRFDA
jgi:hypothetical protein